MSYDAFISHAKADGAVADEICGSLEEAGFSCWIARRNLVAGDVWAGSVTQAIQESRSFILVFSEHSNDSPQVLREVALADSRRIPVIQYRIQSVEPKGPLEYYLSGTQWLDASGRPGELLRHQALGAAVRKHASARVSLSVPSIDTVPTAEALKPVPMAIPAPQLMPAARAPVLPRAGGGPEAMPAAAAPALPEAGATKEAQQAATRPASPGADAASELVDYEGNAAQPPSAETLQPPKAAQVRRWLLPLIAACSLVGLGLTYWLAHRPTGATVGKTASTTASPPAGSAKIGGTATPGRIEGRPPAPSLMPPPDPGVAAEIDSFWFKPKLEEADFQGVSGTCGPYGTDQGNELNLRKNRTDEPAFLHAVAFDAIAHLPFPSDQLLKRSQWSAQALAAIEAFEGVGVTVTGFIVKIKAGGAESANCNSRSAADVDWNIPLVRAAGDPESSGIVVETTPRVRRKHPGWDLKALKPWVNSTSPVRISGWLMLDSAQKSTLGRYRATLWEIHPVTRIEVFNQGQWMDLDHRSGTSID